MTRHGMIRAAWRFEGESVRYKLATPVPAALMVGNETREVPAGSYTFWENEVR